MPTSPPAFTALLLGRAAVEHAQATPVARQVLQALRKQKVPCLWLDDTGEPGATTTRLPKWPTAASPCLDSAPWPAPDACWQALIELKVGRLDGCVLVSDSPGLLAAGLNAGLWTIGLAGCHRNPAGHKPAPEGPAAGPVAGERQLEQARSQTTLELYRLGVHSVIDHLGELNLCLDDIQQRRASGEKP